jgi:hypothetical protein
MTTITLRSQRRRLMDQATDAYAGWRDQCGAVERAYRYWASARGRDAATWYNAYSAALDREERAAERYARLIRRLTPAADMEPARGVASAAGSW